jgi:hypothetical protein
MRRAVRILDREESILNSSHVMGLEPFRLLVNARFPREKVNGKELCQVGLKDEKGGTVQDQAQARKLI